MKYNGIIMWCKSILILSLILLFNSCAEEKTIQNKTKQDIALETAKLLYNEFLKERGIDLDELPQSNEYDQKSDDEIEEEVLKQINTGIESYIQEEHIYNFDDRKLSVFYFREPGLSRFFAYIIAVDDDLTPYVLYPIREGQFSILSSQLIQKIENKKEASIAFNFIEKTYLLPFIIDKSFEILEYNRDSIHVIRDKEIIYSKINYMLHNYSDNKILLRNKMIISENCEFTIVFDTLLNTYSNYFDNDYIKKFHLENNDTLIIYFDYHELKKEGSQIE